MNGQGSTGNVIAAACSFFVPGLGQLVQGRVLAAVLFLIMAGVLWLIGILTFGILMFLTIIPHLWATIDAALWRPRLERY